VDEVGHTDCAKVEREENGESGWVWDIAFWEHWVVNPGLRSISGSSEGSHRSERSLESFRKHVLIL
jgi:hypothetical protein